MGKVNTMDKTKVPMGEKNGINKKILHLIMLLKIYLGKRIKISPLIQESLNTIIIIIKLHL